MGLKNNERGGTLVMVLLLVAVFTVLGVGLLSLNISASKQFDKKEEQVQARHLAEMGVIHYQAKVDEKINVYNQEFQPVYSTDKDGLKYLDVQASKEKYVRELCQDVHLGALNSEGTEVGTYTVQDIEVKEVVCSSLSFDDQEIIVEVESIGKAKETSKVIEAEVTITPEDTEGGGVVKPPTEGKTDWTVDKVINWTGDPCETGKVAINNKSCKIPEGGISVESVNWVFEEDLIGQGAMVLGWGGVTQALVKGDLINFISLTYSDDKTSTKLVVQGNFISLNQSDLVVNNGENGKYPFVVCGDAILDKTPSRVNPGMFYVKGEVYENGQKVNKYKGMMPDMKEYVAGACPTAPGEDYNWGVEPDVNAEYK